ncbi:MAG: class I SAM-dependent methyltransferase [Candidatus Latescibacterota bacterium]
MEEGHERTDAAGCVGTGANPHAWQQDTYQAWVRRFGMPAEAAARLRRDPTTVLHPLSRHFGDVQGKRVAHLLGSNGVKAVALAMVGAEVTVVDYSPANARYAGELARQAGLDVRYLVCDVLAMPEAEVRAEYDLVLAELGVVHYFTDLAPFMQVVLRLLRPGGRFVLRDFHPVSTKLLSFRGSTAKVRKCRVTGDYFDTSLEEHPAPWAKHLPPGEGGSAPCVHWRRWTLGEVVTAVAAAGLFVRLLEEEPNLSSEVFDRGIPKTFTLVADKVPVA